MIGTRENDHQAAEGAKAKRMKKGIAYFVGLPIVRKKNKTPRKSIRNGVHHSKENATDTGRFKCKGSHLSGFKKMSITFDGLLSVKPEAILKGV
jgi:hypothetical protein